MSYRICSVGVGISYPPKCILRFLISVIAGKLNWRGVYFNKVQESRRIFSRAVFIDKYCLHPTKRCSGQYPWSSHLTNGDPRFQTRFYPRGHQCYPRQDRRNPNSGILITMVLSAVRIRSALQGASSIICSTAGYRRSPVEGLYPFAYELTEVKREFHLHIRSVILFQQIQVPLKIYLLATYKRVRG